MIWQQLIATALTLIPVSGAPIAGPPPGYDERPLYSEAPPYYGPPARNSRYYQGRPVPPPPGFYLAPGSVVPYIMPDGSPMLAPPCRGRLPCDY